MVVFPLFILPYAPLTAMGGLGILLVKKNMDAVTYSYEDGRNVLTIQESCNEVLSY